MSHKFNKPKLVVLTGAGMSAESGIATFRGSDGLWESHRIEDVATPQAWQRDPELVLEFYNQRRKKILEAHPNVGHRILAELQSHYEVLIITQNIDDLHERAGSEYVLHLHGEIRKARSTARSEWVVTLDGWQLKRGDRCPLGSQLRPHIVWFGEEVPMIEPAARLVAEAVLLVVVGTSLQVYPAAGLVNYAPKAIPKYIIDPHIPNTSATRNFIAIAKGASEGLAELKTLLQAASG